METYNKRKDLADFVLNSKVNIVERVNIDGGFEVEKVKLSYQDNEFTFPAVVQVENDRRVFAADYYVEIKNYEDLTRGPDYPKAGETQLAFIGEQLYFQHSGNPADVRRSQREAGRGKNQVFRQEN